MSAENLTAINDFSSEDVSQVYELSSQLKDDLKHQRPHVHLAGKILAMYFEKPSLRTRCTFEAGIYQLGGHAIHMESHAVGLGKRESVHDVAKNLERWVELVMIRTYDQEIVTELARYSSVPVINALTDQEHPCQALADLFTVKEHKNKLQGLTLTFVGDGNNICASLACLCPLVGMNFRHTGPAEFQLPESIMQTAQQLAGSAGTLIEYQEDPAAAVKDVDLIYTDVWASMGQEGQAEERKKIFMPYQVNRTLVSQAPADALIMHDLPAHRGEEITNEVIDSAKSIVFDQAENRLHVQKGIMLYLYRENNGQ